ncbi:MAG TPA: VCBS repeat-containing protein, partial [Verrucomicrobiae bacterium]|nr:VCBS repeat-containing protein [Verrucomicrobiae bacterium]
MNGQKQFWKLALVFGLGALVAVAILFEFKSSVMRAAPEPSSTVPAALSVTPAIAARKDDLFEDVTAKAGITFVHQYCDSRIANILESNGAGGVWLDYDGDGFMDLYLVNSGPLEGVTHQPRGTAREPNRLYRNRGDGTFEDVTAKAGVQGAGYGTAAIAADYDNDG